MHKNFFYLFYSYNPFKTSSFCKTFHRNLVPWFPMFLGLIFIKNPHTSTHPLAVYLGILWFFSWPHPPGIICVGSLKMTPHIYCEPGKILNIIGQKVGPHYFYWVTFSWPCFTISFVIFSKTVQLTLACMNKEGFPTHILWLLVWHHT